MSETGYRKIRFSELNTGSASEIVTVPVGGGETYLNLPITSFGFQSKISAVLSVNVVRQPPIVDAVYTPAYGITSGGTVVGLTLSAAVGTTLNVQVLAMGI